MTMTIPELEQTLRAYADAKNRHDVDTIVAMRTDDCFDEALPLGTRIEGPEAVRAYFTDFFTTLPDYRGDFDGVAYGEDTAVVWGRWGGTTPDGRTLSIPVTFVCTFRDGKVVGDTYYFDSATLAEQSGMPLEQLRAAAPAVGGPA